MTRVSFASLIGLAAILPYYHEQPLTITREGMGIVVTPYSDPLAYVNNLLWSVWDQQAMPTPPISEGLYTLYGYSETSYGVAELRAAEYERTGGGRNGPLWVRLRGDSIEGYRERLHAEGFAGVVALKGDDVGRSGMVSLWDDERKAWTPFVRVLVADSLGDGWDRLSVTWHPFEGHTPMPWIGDVSKDMVEAVGLGRLVDNNWSGFMRLALDEAANRTIYWPDYEAASGD